MGWKTKYGHKRIKYNQNNQQIDKHKGLSINYIKKITCEHFNITIDQLSLKSRKREIVIPRQFSHLLAYRLTSHSLSIIGSSIGEKDHTTILNSVKTIQGLLSVDLYFKKTHIPLIESFGITVEDISTYKRPQSRAFNHN